MGDSPLIRDEMPDSRQPQKQGGRFSHVPLAVRRALLVALGGYAVVGLFGIAFAVVDTAWPQLPSSGTVVAAALVAAPLALALMWPRLGAVKAFGVELSLSDATVEMDADLAAVLMGQQYFSDPRAIIEGITTAIRSGAELVEVNLRDGQYWWSSRLFLLAALASDYTSVRAMVFVEDGTRRVFGGFAAPTLVRSALGARLPALERAYAEIKERAQTDLTPVARVTHITAEWPGQFRGTDAKPLVEDKLPRVSSECLADSIAALGKRFDSASVEWSGVSDQQVVKAVALEYDSPYVALLRGHTLDRVVSRIKLGEHIARRALD